MTEKEFVKELTWFAEYYEKKLNKIQSRMWYEVFKKYPAADFHNALMEYLRSSKIDRFPAIGDVREKIVFIITQQNEARHHQLKEAPISEEERRVLAKLFHDSIPESIRENMNESIFNDEPQHISQAFEERRGERGCPADKD